MNEINYSGHENLDVMKEARKYNKYLLNLVMASSKKSDTLVDFGAGSGTFALPLVSIGYRVVCVETDPIFSAKLKSQGIEVLNDLADAQDESIDYIYSLNVLEHIVDDGDTIAVWFRKLRPGGKLLVYVPAFQILFSSMDHKVGHIRRYSKNELMRKVSKPGFQILESRYADVIGFLAALTYKVLQKEEGTIDLRMLKFYDRWIFPLSKLLDVITSQIGGKNVYVRAVKPPNLSN
jgi:SAM-dependent methyltransferase